MIIMKQVGLINTSSKFRIFIIDFMRTKQHPIHLVSEVNTTSPSAFIPFCDFGGNMSSMGIKIEGLDVPVCNSFQARILYDQLCYEVDLNKFSHKENLDRELKLGLNFLMDYNEDRQLDVENNLKMLVGSEDTLATKLIESDDNQHASIYFNTIGNYLKNIYFKFLVLF